MKTSKKIFTIFIGCALIVSGLFFSTETARAGGVVNIIAPFIAPLLPIFTDPLFWTIIDYNSCDINVLWGCNGGGPSSGGSTPNINGPNGPTGPGGGGGDCPNPPRRCLSPLGYCQGDTYNDSCGDPNCTGEADCSGGGGGGGGNNYYVPPSCDSTTNYGGWSDCNAACHNYGSQSRDVSGTNSDCTTFSYPDSQSCYVSCPPVCDFSTNPSIIVLPQTSTLSWVCQYAEYGCSIDNKIGSVNSSSGSVNVVPSKTTTYTLNCNGIDGSRSWQATVTNAFEPIIREVIPR